ncbi:hypothetical protein R1sor_022618 [Riccia sorocarpa]|uniref:FAF domain-containing protein n=1 Tax=Riccia sorocarpa TaxID=122646 RepID=A0ABD3GMD5_9MARC
MKSAYPSSQSFFDASSDSIRTTDVEKCRTSSSFSSLSDLFGRKSKGRSELFSNVRTPVFVPAEVTFPSRKNRPECEEHRLAEKVSLWHEWGSGECPGEESSGLLSDMFKSPSPELFRASSSNLFPSLGSTANVNVAPQEFTFPERRKRVDESWREQRGFREDWVFTAEEDNVRETTPEVRNEPSRSKPLSLFTNLGSSNQQPESPKRNWKDYSNCGEPTLSTECSTSGSSSSSSSGVHSLKKNPERNAWRDWSNTGYADWAEEDDDSEGDSSRADEMQGLSKDRRMEKPSYFSRAASPCGGRSAELRVDVDCREEEAERIQFVKKSGDVYKEKSGTREDTEDSVGSSRNSSSRRDSHEQRSSRQKAHEFPPPLGFLGRQGSLRVPHHLPWVQLQPVRSEGRFILQEVKVTQPVVFEPIREQGRLVLNLIRQDDACEAEMDLRSSADKPLEAEGKHPAMADDELDAAERVLVNEKIKKASKCPKIYPEPYPPLPNEMLFQGTSKQAGDELQNPCSSEQKAGDGQKSVTEGRILPSLDDSGDCSTVSRPGQGSHNWILAENQSVFSSDEEKGPQALLVRESGVSYQTPPLCKAPPVKVIEGASKGLETSGVHNLNSPKAIESSLLLQQKLPRNPSIRSFTVSEDESKERWRLKEEYLDPRPPFISSGQGFDGGLSFKAHSHFLQWSLRTRSDVSGDSDVRLVNYPPITASFLCADGVGKRHHEKRFWEQPCVS